jgi:hypothetical protein
MSEVYAMYWISRTRPLKPVPEILEKYEGGVSFPGLPYRVTVVEGRKEADEDWRKITEAPEAGGVASAPLTETSHLFISPHPFGFPSEPPPKMFFQPLPLSPSELAPRLGIDMLQRFRGKLSKELYAELLSAKLRQT